MAKAGSCCTLRGMTTDLPEEVVSLIISKAVTDDVRGQIFIPMVCKTFYRVWRTRTGIEWALSSGHNCLYNYVSEKTTKMQNSPGFVCEDIRLELEQLSGYEAQKDRAARQQAQAVVPRVSQLQLPVMCRKAMHWSCAQVPREGR